MSTRHLPSPITGVLTVLTVAALVAVAVSRAPQAGEADAAAVAVHQQELVADIGRQLDALVAAEDVEAVGAARRALGRSAAAFDRRLDALVGGGTIVGEDGRTTRLEAVKNREARRALAAAAALWRPLGPPLADLAGGEYSVFSAAGQQVFTDLRARAPQLTADLAAAAAACDGRAAGPGRRAVAARILAGACLLALAGALVLRRRARRPAAAPAADAPGLAPAGAVSRYSALETAPDPVPAPRSDRSALNLGDLAATVDPVTVDMGTVAASTEKMRTAIDSVAVALDGMLHRLQDLGDEAAEGDCMVRGAGDAADFCAQVAAELADNVREMGAVVTRVGELALRSRETAAAITRDAQQTGRSATPFTDAVAEQVRELAARTSHATAEIEHTISRMLSRTREYEEAVAQILKHVSAIHKVSRDLGRLALDPPTGAEAGLSQPHTRVLEPVAGPPPADSLASAEPTLAPAPASADGGEPAADPEPISVDPGPDAGEPFGARPNVFLLNDPGRTPKPHEGVVS